MIDPFKLKKIRRDALQLRLAIRALMTAGPADGADGLACFQALGAAFTSAELTMDALAMAAGLHRDPFVLRSRYR